MNKKQIGYIILGVALFFAYCSHGNKNAARDRSSQSRGYSCWQEEEIDEMRADLNYYEDLIERKGIKED